MFFDNLLSIKLYPFLKFQLMVAFLLIIPLYGFSQIGVTTSYKLNNFVNFKGVKIYHNGEKFFYHPGNAFELGLQYWFRLKNRRVEFLPEISFSKGFSASDFYDVNFMFNSRFYLLDFLNDCNCPTFSKQNTFFKKGFFLSASPMLSMLQLPGSSKKILVGGRVGLGLDIGISDQITVSPTLNFGSTTKINRNSTYPEILSFDETRSNYIFVMSGLSFIYRFDDQNTF